jgi:hypothetical protein
MKRALIKTQIPVSMDNEYLKDRSSVVAFNERNEQMVREYQIAIENMEIQRERLADCVRTEGVNQMTACKDQREKYFALCNDRFKGMIFPEDAQPANRGVPGLTVSK